MVQRPKKFRIGCFALLVCLLSLFIAYRVYDRREMVRVTQVWGRLASFPESADHFVIYSTGGMFTRGFRTSFTAPLADIDLWLQDSPGTREVTPERPTPNLRFYLISPGGGAQYAEVTVDESTRTVRIYVYWS